MAEIAVIAPQREIGDLVRRLGWRPPAVAVVDARLEDGVAAARQAVAAGARVLVSRGLTYRLISDALPAVPTVEIRFSGYDLLRAYRQAAALGGRAVVVGSREVVDGFAVLAEILGENGRTMTVSIDDDRDFAAGVAEAVRRGADCVIGNQAVAREAEAHGLRGVPVQSGREAVKLAMAIAEDVRGRLRFREMSCRQLDTIINTVDHGIIAIDNRGEVTGINAEAVRLLQGGENGGRQAAFVKSMLALVGEKEKRLGAVEKLGPDAEAVVNYLPIIIDGAVCGMVATLQELGKFRDIEQKTRRELASRGRLAKHRFSDIRSGSPAMRRVIADAARLAGYDSTLLILGETGAGKEYFAHAIHNASRRKNGPFVAVNCASIPENILESELFGYAEGAFTGAKRGGKVGLFEQAHGGTIFLDEVGEMTAECQVRVLRVLQEHEVYRLGDDRTVPVDIRVIAATNRDLWAMVQARQFREDLYYRLEVLTIEVPPLRERKEDIAMFVSQFIGEFNRQYRAAVTGITAEGMESLRQYDWPGNIRELRNLVGRLVALAGAAAITAEDVGRCLKGRLPERTASAFRAAELAAIDAALAATGGNKRRAAEMLGVCRTTLWRKLRNNR